MPVRTELTLRLPNSPGALAAICGLIGREGVGILALTLEGNGQLRMVVDNHVRATGVLRSEHHQVSTREVLVVSVANTPGAFATVAQLVASAGVNVEYAYGGAADGVAGAMAVLGVADPQRAASAAGV